MNAIYTLRDMFYEELEQLVGNGRVSSGMIDQAKKLVGTIKDTYIIEILEAGGYSRDSGASYRGYSQNDGSSYRSYSNGGYSSDGSSQRRDHYVRGHYSRNDAVSHMMDNLNELMSTAETDSQRDAIKKCMERLKNSSEQ